MNVEKNGKKFNLNYHKAKHIDMYRNEKHFVTVTAFRASQVSVGSQSVPKQRNDILCK